MRDVEGVGSGFFWGEVGGVSCGGLIGGECVGMGRNSYFGDDKAWSGSGSMDFSSRIKPSCP
jgi:hypothetical protein